MTYPVLLIDWCLYPDLADNIWHAQMAGWPRLLTYCRPDLTVKKANRKSAMRYEHEGQWYHITSRGYSVVTNILLRARWKEATAGSVTFRRSKTVRKAG